MTLSPIYLKVPRDSYEDDDDSSDDSKYREDRELEKTQAKDTGELTPTLIFSRKPSRITLGPRCWKSNMSLVSLLGMTKMTQASVWPMSSTRKWRRLLMSNMTLKTIHWNKDDRSIGFG